MVLEERLEELEAVAFGDLEPREKLERLFEAADDPDYTLRHKAYHLLKEIKEQRAVPFLLKRLAEKSLREEDALRMMDILGDLKRDTALVLRRFLRHKNPYLVRGALTAMAKGGGSRSLDVILAYAASGKSGIIRRELFGEFLGYMLERDPRLRNRLDQRILEDQGVRSYLRDMELKGPKYGRLSVYPSNDYWALRARAEGLDYGLFKYRTESIHRKKIEQSYSDIPSDMR